MIVVSDMNGTLTEGSPIRGMVDWVRHHQSAARANLYFASIIPSWFLVKAGIIDFGWWTKYAMTTAMPLIKNATPEIVVEAAEWAVEHDLWLTRREDVIARLHAHIAEGADVYIASSAYEPTTRAFADRIGAKAIGSPVEVANGRMVFAGDIAANEAKLDTVLARLGGVAIDVAYGDTASDIPLLEYAGHAVAVYPDKVLRDHALAHGWEVLGSRDE